MHPRLYGRSWPHGLLHTHVPDPLGPCGEKSSRTCRVWTVRSSDCLASILQEPYLRRKRRDCVRTNMAFGFLLRLVTKKRIPPFLFREQSSEQQQSGSVCLPCRQFLPWLPWSFHHQCRGQTPFTSRGWLRSCGSGYSIGSATCPGVAGSRHSFDLGSRVSPQHGIEGLDHRDFGFLFPPQRLVLLTNGPLVLRDAWYFSAGDD